MKWYVILAIVLLVPVGAYLRDQTYKNMNGRSTVREDVKSILQYIAAKCKRRKHK